MRGADPPTSLSQAVFPPPKEGCLVPDQRGACVPPPEDFGLGTIPRGANPKGQPLRGCFRSNPPQDGPPDLGIARDLLGVFLVALLPILTDFYRLSWEIYS